MKWFPRALCAIMLITLHSCTLLSFFDIDLFTKEEQNNEEKMLTAVFSFCDKDYTHYVLSENWDKYYTGYGNNSQSVYGLPDVATNMFGIRIRDYIAKADNATMECTIGLSFPEKSNWKEESINRPLPIIGNKSQRNLSEYESLVYFDLWFDDEIGDRKHRAYLCDSGTVTITDITTDDIKEDVVFITFDINAQTEEELPFMGHVTARIWLY